MKRAIFVLVLALAACNTPTPRLQLVFAGSPSQACPSTTCGGVPMNCKTVMSIRIFDPADAASPYVWQCVSVSPQQDNNMCALTGVDLVSTPIPVRDLEGQGALYPATEIPPDPTRKGELMCPTTVEYNDSTGFPVEQPVTPALGGRAFYHPGDETVVVTLGCTHLDAINESCAASSLVTVTATIDDFDTRIPVTGGPDGLADRLWVSVGEPRVFDNMSVLGASDVRSLARSIDGPIPAWGGDIEYQFRKHACLEVLEIAGQTTATVRCTSVSLDPHLELHGVWMAKQRLDEILLALGTPEFPAEGLTVGVVVDGAGNPVDGAVVSASGSTVAYLSKQRDAFISGATSTTGIFISRDAAFGTVFSTGGPGQPTVSGIAGLVEGTVTIVILQSGGPAA